MRADRLLSLLMLLQARGQMTALALSESLGVSERTIYRDIEALSMAGVPVYSERGPGGGCSLVDSYRTTLTGLNQDEIRALFMLSIPAPLAALGVDHNLKAALLKLTASLPPSHSETAVHKRIHLDSTWWFQSQEAITPHLHIIHQAIWQDKLVRLTYRLPFGTSATHIVEPYGLVAKANIWYLVYQREGHMQVKQLSAITDAMSLDDSFLRDDDFDLAEFWSAWCIDYENNRPQYPVKARVSPDLLPFLPQLFGTHDLNIIEEGDWPTMMLPFETFEDARTRILGLGRAIEVLEPLPLRLSIIDFAHQIVGFYNNLTK